MKKVYITLLSALFAGSAFAKLCQTTVWSFLMQQATHTPLL